MNYNQGKQQSDSYSGLRGTPYADQTYQNYNQSLQDLSGIAQRTRNPSMGGGLNAQGQTQYGGFSGSQMLPGGRFGLGSNADSGVNEMLSRVFGFQSANSAARGQIQPESFGNVAGSAVTRALPSLIPQIQAWQQAQFQAPMMVGGYDMGNAANVANAYGQATGQQSNMTGNQFGFGFHPGELIPKGSSGGG